MSRVARVSSEEIERHSNGFGIEYRASRGSTYNGLLFSSGSVAENGWEDLNELREEDIWGEEETSSWNHDEMKDTRQVDQPIKEKNVSTKAVANSRRSWLSIELQAAGQKNDKGGIGLTSLEPAQNGSYGGQGGGKKKDSNGGWAAKFSTRKVNIPQYGNGGGGGGGGYNNGWHEHEAMAKGGVPQSAPMSVPVWAKCHAVEAEGEEEDEEDGDGHVEDEDARLPPHEIVAREYARSQSTTFSVFEGTGRTLKGMDLRRVRNAVWRRTGFVD